MNNLNDIRCSWEKGLTPLVVINRPGVVLVILARTIESSVFHCHRYFIMGSRWECSADGQNIPIAAVFSWLNNPCAASTRDYVYPPVCNEFTEYQFMAATIRATEIIEASRIKAPPLEQFSDPETGQPLFRQNRTNPPK